MLTEAAPASPCGGLAAPVVWELGVPSSTLILSLNSVALKSLSLSDVWNEGLGSVLPKVLPCLIFTVLLAWIKLLILKPCISAFEALNGSL